MIAPKRTESKGFTLVEILVVATVIAVLTTMGTVSYGSISRRSRDAKRKSDVEQLRSALEMYRADNGTYPNVCLTPSDVVTCLDTPLRPNYIPAIPADPKGNAYRFQATNSYYGYCVVAYTEFDYSAGNTCTDGSVPPSGYYLYGVRNP